MSKNFDEEVRAERLLRDKTFIIGGEIFTYIVDLTPEQFSEIIAEYAAMDVATVPRGEATRIVDEAIRGFLATDDDRARWDALRTRERVESPEGAGELAIIAYDMRQVLLYLIQEQTGRPTEAPSRSGNGRESTGPSSTDTSSLQVVASGDSAS